MEEIIFEGYVFQSKSWSPNWNNGQEEDAQWRSACIRGSGVNPGIYTSESKAWSSNGGKVVKEVDNPNWRRFQHPDGLVETWIQYNNRTTFERRRVVKVKVVVTE